MKYQKKYHHIQKKEDILHVNINISWENIFPTIHFLPGKKNHVEEV